MDGSMQQATIPPDSKLERGLLLYCTVHYIHIENKQKELLATFHGFEHLHFLVTLSHQNSLYTLIINIYLKEAFNVATVFLKNRSDMIYAPL